MGIGEHVGCCARRGCLHMCPCLLGSTRGCVACPSRDPTSTWIAATPNATRPYLLGYQSLKSPSNLRFQRLSAYVPDLQRGIIGEAEPAQPSPHPIQIPESGLAAP